MNYLRYAIVFLAVALGAALAIRLLEAQFNTALGSAAHLMVPAMIGALVEGQQHARVHKAKPASAPMWRFAWIATGIAVVLNVGLAFGAGRFAPEFGKLAIAPFGSRQFGLLLALYAGGYLICNRLFLGIGAGNQLSLMRSRGEID